MARTLRLAMLRPDFSNSTARALPKIAILLAYFQLRPAEAANLDSTTRL